MFAKKEKIIEPDKISEGAGAEVKRLFPSSTLNHVDPFVLMDEFFVRPGTGFPEHPHGGFEALTYMIEGEFKHKDNLGNDSVVGPGGVQHFSAGKEIRHSEMPGKEKMSHGIQLWINLPREKKDSEPRYQKTEKERLPVEKGDHCTIRTLVGGSSPIKLQTDILYRDHALEKDKDVEITIPDDHAGFLYVYEGEIEIKEKRKKFTVDKGRAFLPEEGSKISVRGKEKSRFVVISGEPIGEKIHLQGSFVR